MQKKLSSLSPNHKKLQIIEIGDANQNETKKFVVHCIHFFETIFLDAYK